MAIGREDFEDSNEGQEEAGAIQQERRYTTPELLQKVLQVRERIMRESKGRLFEDSAELIRQQREERTRYLMELFTGDKADAKTHNQ